MISAPNLRQLSSGSSPLNYGQHPGESWTWRCTCCRDLFRNCAAIGLLLAALLLPSCSLFKPVQSSEKSKDTETLDPIQGRRVYDPRTGEWVVVKQAPTEIMDTVKWKEVDETRVPPITSTGYVPDLPAGRPAAPVDPNASVFLNSYNVAYILPFLTDRFQVNGGTIDANSSWALNFYAGARMALDQLETEGVSLSVNVLDTKLPETALSPLLRTNQDLPKANLIIGPYRRDNIREVAEFARRNNIAFVSPYSAATDLSAGNPNYIQVSPSLEAHCAAIMRHALRQARPNQIILVSRADTVERSRLRFFQEEYFRSAGAMTANKLQEYVVSSRTADYSDMNVMPFIQLQDTTVFIVPSWDETFIYSLLRKLDVSRQAYQTIIVYGMPQWMSFEHVDLDYFEKLNVHISSNYYLDPLAPEVQFYKRQYFDRYGTVPPLEAYLGYDVTLFFGRALQKYGTRFQYRMDAERGQYLHTRFEFEPVVRPGTTGMENRPIERFENKYVNILKFEDYQFILAN